MVDNFFKLKTNEYLQQCDLQDVISFESKTWVSVSKIKEIVRQSFLHQGINTVANYISGRSDLKNSYIWFNQGEDCEILKAGSKGWHKDKVKINVTLEFIPDEPEKIESPLDDIRKAEIDDIEYN